MPQPDDWWSDQPLASKKVPSASPSARAKPTREDQVALAKYRDAADAADAVTRNSQDFESRDQRFGTGPTNAAMFGAMYPNTDGWLGGLKALGGAALRETLGHMLYSNQDHADYQYLNSRASAINNAALRMEKGVQTKSDEERVARENVGIDKTHAVNHDIIAAQRQAADLARLRNATAAQWVANYGSLSGTMDDRGRTYEQAYQEEAAARTRFRSAPPSTRKQPRGRVLIDMNGHPVR